MILTTIVSDAGKHTPDGNVPLGWITPSRLNPRKHFDDAALADLAASLKQNTMLEPIVVRQLTEAQSVHRLGKHLEIIAGERRYRAAILADLPLVPIRNLGAIDDATALRLALVENLQRVDLDPIEQAEGYRALNQVAGLKQAQIAAAVNLSQPTIANRMRLLDLPDEVQELIRSSQLSAAHGIALARHKEYPRLQETLGKIAVRRRLSSAELELEPDGTIVEELVRAGVLRKVESYICEFDVAICKACPFGAYRARWAWSSVCLKPSHYDELQATAKAEKEQNLATAVAKATQKTAAKGEELPKLDKLPSGSYERIDSSPPLGCTVDCECRSAAVHYGGNIVPICTNPQQFRLLKRRTTIATNRSRHAEVKALRTAMTTKIDALGDLDVGQLAIVFAQALLGTALESRFVERGWRAALKRRKLGDGHQTDVDSLKRLAKGSLVDLSRLGLEAVLTGELDAYDEAQRGQASLTRAFVVPELDAKLDAALKAGPIDPDLPAAIDERRANARARLMAAGILQPPPKDPPIEHEFEDAPSNLTDLTSAQVYRDDLTEDQEDRIVAVADVGDEPCCDRCGRKVSDLPDGTDLEEWPAHGLLCAGCAMDLDDVDPDDFRAKQMLEPLQPKLRRPAVAHKHGLPRPAAGGGVV